jgi:hypothetical protein
MQDRYLVRLMVNYPLDYRREQYVHVFQDQHAMAFDIARLYPL